MAKVLSRVVPAYRAGYRRKFTRAELERMYDAGILQPDEKIELIGGELIAKELPMKSAHATAIRLCVKRRCVRHSVKAMSFGFNSLSP
ncbi:hypothetical protein GXSOP10_1376 [Armatimonadetes bacterium GXS]|nr:hypothetical protein GXSOP10_1376 [Armatimonadetes bacterium GXS]